MKLVADGAQCGREAVSRLLIAKLARRGPSDLEGILCGYATLRTAVGRQLSRKMTHAGDVPASD